MRGGASDHGMKAAMDKQKSQQFMQKVVGDVGTAMAAGLVLIGDQTGLFKAMAGAGPMHSDQLIKRTGLHPRYVEEWLAAMVCAGYIEYDAPADLYRLPDEHAMFLTDPSTEYYLGGLFKGLPRLLATVPRIAAAYATGQGVSFRDFGDEMPWALEQMNRPVYENRLVKTWLPNLPDVVSRLQAGGSAIDIGCGTGVVPLILAKHFPAARITGLDADSRSIAIARGYARDAGLADRVEFVEAKAEQLDSSQRYDFISTFDCIHDLPDPAAVLRRLRQALAPAGVYLMVEPKAADRLAENINPFGKMLYSISCLHCVPQSLAQGGPGLGACWGEAKARELGRQAGFSGFDVLPIRSPAQSFYALRA